MWWAGYLVGKASGWQGSAGFEGSWTWHDWILDWIWAPLRGVWCKDDGLHWEQGSLLQCWADFLFLISTVKRAFFQLPVEWCGRAFDWLVEIFRLDFYSMLLGCGSHPPRAVVCWLFAVLLFFCPSLLAHSWLLMSFIGTIEPDDIFQKGSRSIWRFGGSHCFPRLFIFADCWVFLLQSLLHYVINVIAEFICTDILLHYAIINSL